MIVSSLFSSRYPRVTRSAAITLLLVFVGPGAFTPVFGQDGIGSAIQELAALVRGGEFEKAVPAASALVVAHPESFDVHLASFRTHFEAFQFQPEGPNGGKYLEEALKRLLFARRLDPLSPEAWELNLSFWNPSLLDQGPESQEGRRLLGEAETFFGNNQLAEAVEPLTRLTEMEPNYGPARLRLGEIHLARGDHQEALRLARTVTRHNPSNPEGFLLQARTLALMDAAEEALAQLFEALKADPGYPPAWQLLGQLDLDGATIEHMGRYFPKPVWWIIDREIEEDQEGDLAGVREVTRPAWKSYITSKVRWRKFIFQRRNPQFKVYRYTFREELTAVTDMLVIWQEVRASNPDAEDILLDHWLDASQAGALEAAVFLDLFVEQFRRDFVLWKRETPGKLKEYFYKFVLPRVTDKAIEHETGNSG